MGNSVVKKDVSGGEPQGGRGDDEDAVYPKDSPYTAGAHHSPARGGWAAAWQLCLAAAVASAAISSQ